MARKTICLRPKHNAPRLTEQDLHSEEDLAVLRRLQKKYSSSSFPYNRDFRNIFSGQLKISSFTAARHLKIKTEPSTPLCEAVSQCADQCKASLKTRNQLPNQTIKDGVKTEEFQYELLDPACEPSIRNYQVELEENGYGFQTAHWHTESSCGSGAQRKHPPGHGDSGYGTTQKVLNASHSPLNPLFLLDPEENGIVAQNACKSQSFPVRPRFGKESTPEYPSDLIEHSGNQSKFIPPNRKKSKISHIPDENDARGYLSASTDNIFRSLASQEDNFTLMPCRWDKMSALPSPVLLTTNTSYRYTCSDVKVPVAKTSQSDTNTRESTGLASRLDTADLSGNLDPMHKEQMSSWMSAGKCSANRNERTMSAVGGKHGPLKKENEGSRERIQKKLTAYSSNNKETEVISSRIKQTVMDEGDKKMFVQQKQSTTESRTDQSEEQSVADNSLQDIRAMKSEERQQLATQICRCKCLGCMVYYEDGTIHTDSLVCNRPKVRGFILHFEENTYLFPVPGLCDAETVQWGRHMLYELLRKEDMVKVAIDCKHFVKCLLENFSLEDNRGVVEWHFEDPIIAGWLLNPDNPPHTLHALCKIMCIEHTQTRGPHSEMMASMAVMERLRASLKKKGLWPLFYHVEMPLTPLLASMELQPIKINVPTFLTFSDVLKKKLGKVERKAYQLAGHSFCINSTQQLRQLLYEELKLDQQLPGSKKVTLTASAHHKSTSEPMLRQLVPAHPLPSVILEYRHLWKLKSTYIDGMLDSLKGGVLHTHWDQTAAATGRLVSSQPNIQAIPKTPTTITDYEDNYIVGSEAKTFDIYAREPFICGEGNVFLAADFQQIELRLLAHLANDSCLKDMFSSDKSADIFIQLTSQWLSKPCQDVVHAEREQTKRVVYSILYGVGKERLAEYLKVPSTRAKDIMDSFLVSFPAIQKFTRKCIEYAQQHGYTETIMGRKRWFDKLHHKAAHVRAQAERQAVNFCVQGSAADLCKRAMLRVEQALHKKTDLSARLLIHIHDELVWELPQRRLQETRVISRIQTIGVAQDGVLVLASHTHHTTSVGSQQTPHSPHISPTCGRQTIGDDMH